MLRDIADILALTLFLLMVAVFADAIATRSTDRGGAFKSDIAPRCADAPQPCRGRA